MFSKENNLTKWVGLTWSWSGGFGSRKYLSSKQMAYAYDIPFTLTNTISSNYLFLSHGIFSLPLLVALVWGGLSVALVLLGWLLLLWLPGVCRDG